jgi:hypothetical protein
MNNDMKQLFAIAIAVFFSSSAAVAAETTLTGVISDTMCAMGHESNIEHARENSGRTMTNQECTVGCVMRRGQQYVLVANGKTYRIENQDHASLATFAAQTVKMTGTLAGDVFKVSKVTPAASK